MGESEVLGAFRYPHVLQAVSEAPWAILPAKLLAIRDLLAFRAAGGHLTDEEIRERVGSPRAAQPLRVTPAQGGGKVAVLPFYGTVAQRMGLLAQSSGGVSTEAFAQLFQQAMDDPTVAAVVIEFDSPGGSVFGVEELAQRIYDARGQGKPIVAQVNPLCASAAYWVASQCDEIVATPSAQVGSIGVYTIHTDLSAQNEQLGEAYTVISAGKYKAEALPFGPLTPEAQAAIQDEVNASYGMFTQAVARGRGATPDEVRNGYGQGRMVGARQAKTLNLVDRVDTLDGTVTRLAKGSSRATISQRHAALELIPEGETNMAKHGQQAGFSAKAVPVNDSPKIAPADEPWDAGEVEKSLPEDDQKAWLKVFAWYDETAPDPDNDDLPDAKSAWKLPHAKVDGTLVPRGLHAAAARLMQANTDIPEKDMAGVKAHLAHHYAELKETPPWEQEGAASTTEEQARVASEPAPTKSTQGAKSVDEQEFRATLAEYQTKLADKDKQLEALSASSKQQAEQIATLQAAERRKRFTDLVMGRSAEKDGLRWYGEVAQNVSMLETMASAFGEDSEQFRQYVGMQEATAKQLNEVTKALGSDAGPGESNGAWARILAEADKLRAADSKMTHEQAVASAMERHPDLYAEYLAETRGEK
ncbi:MAG: S49 family peptidase [Patescibacteria group bacterium]|nr:S49 family peptidase [Patescibacteria group bacterium]